jgi:putative membrane protein
MRSINGKHSTPKGRLEEKAVLRDLLAVDRTLLALERTLLAYTRTAFILFTAGLTVLKLLYADPFFRVAGTILLPSAAAVFLFGVIRFILLRRKLSKTRRRRSPYTRAG